MAVKTIFGSKQRLFARQFQDQCRAQRGDGFSRLVGASREKGRASVCRARDDDRSGRHAETARGLGSDFSNGCTSRNDRGQLAALDARGLDPFRPSPGDRIIPGFQCVAFVTDIEAS